MQDAVEAPAFEKVRADAENLTTVPEVGMYTQDAFARRLHMEQRRTERSRRPFILMLMEAGAGMDPGLWERIQSAVASNVRETDIRGWYQEDSVFGVIFTEIGAEIESIRKVLLDKLSSALHNRLTDQQAAQITFSFCSFPDDWNKSGPDGNSRSSLYPEAASNTNRLTFLGKRMLDIAGSLGALALAAPALVAIGVVVKLTSDGPILFRQRRVGQYGGDFTFLKFRSMYADNDPRVHEEYVKKMIAGELPADSQTDASGKAVFKLTNDSRITPIGKFLRKTSLDELPQFLNVLKGEMSLVGPRPPIPYEVEAYDIWHRRRLLAVKPGITGLWQVTGRSKTTFDEMVRLDLQYAKTWSLWMDIKILLQTPRAVIIGEGAR